MFRGVFIVLDISVYLHLVFHNALLIIQLYAAFAAQLSSTRLVLPFTCHHFLPFFFSYKHLKQMAQMSILGCLFQPPLAHLILIYSSLYTTLSSPILWQVELASNSNSHNPCCSMLPYSSLTIFLSLYLQHVLSLFTRTVSQQSYYVGRKRAISLSSFRFTVWMCFCHYKAKIYQHASQINSPTKFHLFVLATRRENYVRPFRARFSFWRGPRRLLVNLSFPIS